MDHCLSPGQVAAVARCIDQLADAPGAQLSIDSPTALGSQYLAAIPDNDHAPVVIYRATSAGEQGDLLVTALADRVTYAEHQSAARRRIKDHPPDRALSILATAQVFGHGRICPSAGL